MTRRSKRELERALEGLRGGDAHPAGERSLSEAQKEAVRAVLRYRRSASNPGDGHSAGQAGGLSATMVEEAVGEIDSRHVEPLAELCDLEVTA